MSVINQIEVLNRQLCFRCQTFLDVCGSWQLQTSDWKPHLLLHSFQSRMFTVAHCQQQYTFLSCLLYIINMQRPPSRLVKIATTSVAVLLPTDVHGTVFISIYKWNKSTTSRGTFANSQAYFLFKHYTSRIMLPILHPVRIKIKRYEKSNLLRLSHLFCSPRD